MWGIIQVILNILNNARDALEINNIQKRFVKIELSKDNANIYLAITDNAGGIPEAILNKIFDPYFTTKHQSQGTGIGLYMSMQIIRDNFKGKIFVENKEITFDETQFIGASFKIELPIFA